MGKQVKVGVQQGGGPRQVIAGRGCSSPLAKRKRRVPSNKAQIQHTVMQVKELCREADPTHPKTVSVDTIEDFHELRDKGGILGGINLRVFFFLDKVRGAEIVVLGAIRKRNNGQPPGGQAQNGPSQTQVSSGGLWLIALVCRQAAVQKGGGVSLISPRSF